VAPANLPTSPPEPDLPDPAPAPDDVPARDDSQELIESQQPAPLAEEALAFEPPLPEAAFVPRPASDGLPPMVRAVRALGLLFLEGMSLGLALWSLRVRDKLPPYVASNELTKRGRSFLLGNMGGGALLACLIAIVILLVCWRRKRAAAGVDLISRLAWRGAPLIVAGLIPPLFQYRLWVDRDLTFLAQTTVVVMGLQALVRAALKTPPVWNPTLGERIRRWRWVARLSPRLAKVRRALPWVIVIGGIVGYAAFFSYSTVRAHRALHTMSFDLGLEENVVWNSLHLSKPAFKSSPFAGPTGSHVGNHFTPLSYLIALPYAIYQHAETLLILQALIMALAAWPLFLFARRHVGNGAAAVLAAAYLCYAPLHGSGLYDFHYPPLGPFFLWMTLYALDARRNILAGVFLVLTLTVREDVSAGIAVIGAMLVITGMRPRAGLIVGLIGAAYFVTVKFIVMPKLAKGSESFLYAYQGLLPSGESGFGGVMKTVLGNPAFTLTSLLEREKLTYLLHIMTPLAFFALRRPIGILFCLPGFLFTLLSTSYPPFIQTSFQYTAHWTSYLFIACVLNLVWVTRTPDANATSTRPRRIAWQVAILFGILATTSQYGAFIQQEYVKGGFGYYSFKVTPQDRERYKSLRELIKMVPPRAKIVASENLVPHVSNRPDAYTLRSGLYDAEYLLFEAPRHGEEGSNIRNAFLAGDFGVVAFKDPFVLAKKGHSKALNESLRSRIGY
jgi:uncharacterized membrane protein